MTTILISVSDFSFMEDSLSVVLGILLPVLFFDGCVGFLDY